MEKEVNKLGYPIDYWPVEKFKNWIEESFGDWPALINNQDIILIEKISDSEYYLTINIAENKHFFNNIDDLFNARLIHKKSINDYKVVDFLNC